MTLEKKLSYALKTKKSEKEVDIRPLIYQYRVEESSILLRVATGSVQNLKPELVLEAFYEANDMEWNPFAFQVHRLNTYTSGENQTFVSLEDLGEDIE